MSELRVGLGIDAHAFADGIPLVLAGVDFPGEPGLAGRTVYLDANRDGFVDTQVITNAPKWTSGLRLNFDVSLSRTFGTVFIERILDLFEAEGIKTLFGIPDPNFVHMFVSAEKRL